MNPFYKNILLISFLLSGSINSSYSQEIEWQKTIGGSGDDELNIVCHTSDGGYILGGSSNSNISGNKTANSRGGNDYWVVKIDSDGAIQWQKTIGGSAEDRLYSLQQTSDGGYILAGSSSSDISGDKTENSAGNVDFWIVKTDGVGNIQWQNTIGGSAQDDLFSVQQTSDGGYILGGNSVSSLSGDKSEVCLGSWDFWIIKLNGAGNIQWQNTIGGNSFDVFSSILQTADGGYIIGGYSGSDISGDKIENCWGVFDYWVVKTDSIGNIQWQNTIGGGSRDLLKSIDQTADGGYILAGMSDSYISGDKTESGFGFFDYWILKIDFVGNVLWQNTIGGNFDDNLISIEEDSSGSFVLGGYSNSDISGDKSEYSQGGNDYWIIKTDSIGNLIWQNTIGGSLNDNFRSLQITPDEGCILGGFSNSNVSGDKLEDSLGIDDYWIVKLTDNYNLIEGMLFADNNINGVQDIGESLLLMKKITEQNTGRFVFTDQNGNYSVSILDTGNYTVTPQTVNWFSPAPLSHAASFTGINQTDSLNDFAFQPQGTFEDVCVTITPMGNFRSGFTASYMISYGNYGNTTVAPTVYFYPYNNVTFQSATLIPNTITLDSVVWNLPAMTPFQTGSIIVTVIVNLGLPIGTLINSSAHIEPYLTDDNPSCNNSNWEVYTTGSFDPNDISVDKKVLTTTQLATAPWLEYLIRFQNTGNDTAFTVKILNPIDTNKLNLSTFEFVDASHPVDLSWINYQRNMEFKFNNILLVDSNANEPLSHGFVHYRIKPKTNLLVGDSITNFVAIYFDFNEPVITNTAKTDIVLSTGIASASSARGKLFVYPNPTESTINITGIPIENGKAQIRLSDIYGKLILEKTITSNTTELETSKLPAGLYLIQAGNLRATFVKQ